MICRPFVEIYSKYFEVSTNCGRTLSNHDFYAAVRDEEDSSYKKTLWTCEMLRSTPDTSLISTNIPLTDSVSAGTRIIDFRMV
jgi:hypothetical protein